jgi:hypothetical protein
MAAVDSDVKGSEPVPSLQPALVTEESRVGPFTSPKDFARDEVNALCREIADKANHLANLVHFHDIRLDRLQDVRLANAMTWLDDARFPHLAPKWPATVAQDMAREAAE